MCENENNEAQVLASRPSRYAMVRNDAGYKFANPSERASLPQAAYDIVDNVQGAERILAQGVRCLDALLMVEALNDHWLNMITHNDDDELGPDDAEFGMSDHR